MDSKIRQLTSIVVLSLVSILLINGFVGELSAEKSTGRSVNQYGSTNSKVCGDRLCSETGGKIIMPWEKVGFQTKQQSCLSFTDHDTCEELEDMNIEEKTRSDINQETNDLKNSTKVNMPTFDSNITLTNTNIPVTIPLHQGYYMGKAIYYIITDSSEPTHADIITKKQGLKVNLAPLLANATKDSLSKTYVFTNGVPGDGVHGFQGEVFTSTPEQTDIYSALTSHVHVTWNAGVSRILDSEKEIMMAAKQNQISLSQLNVVLNMPQIVWPGGQLPVKVNKTLTNDTPFVGGQLLDINLKNKTATFIARQGFDSEGKTIYFIVTAATPIGPANSLGVPNVPKHATLISNPASVDVFHFMNGIPGSGPLGFQAGITSFSLGDVNYSPMSRIYFIEWKDLDGAVLLQTRNNIDAYEKEDLLSVNIARPMGADHLINTPIIDPFQ